MDHIKEAAEIVSAVSVAISAAICTGLLLLKLISRFTKTTKDDKLVEKLKGI